jgi:hypothetical protein
LLSDKMRCEALCYCNTLPRCCKMF